jgi:hypothetical protein
MRLIVISQQLTGEYGTVVAGQEFDCDDAAAYQLVTAGMARKAAPPAVRYETKVIVPEAPEVRAREMFRHLPVSDAEPATVASEGDRMLSATDPSPRGAADSGGRRGRPGPASR